MTDCETFFLYVALAPVLVLLCCRAADWFLMGPECREDVR